MVALIPQSRTGGLPALAQGPGPWCWACSPALASGWKLEGPLGPWMSTPHPMHASGSPPRGLHSHVKGTPRGSGGHGPQPRCSRVGQLLMGVPGEVEALDRYQPTFFYPSSVFFRLLKGISWFLKHSSGDILVKMQYFCHVMLFPHLTLATLSQRSTAPPCPAPHPPSGAPALGPGPERLGKFW